MGAHCGLLKFWQRAIQTAYFFMSELWVASLRELVHLSKLTDLCTFINLFVVFLYYPFGIFGTLPSWAPGSPTVTLSSSWQLTYPGLSSLSFLILVFVSSCYLFLSAARNLSVLSIIRETVIFPHCFSIFNFINFCSYFYFFPSEYFGLNLFFL